MAAKSHGLQLAEERVVHATDYSPEEQLDREQSFSWTAKSNGKQEEGSGLHRSSSDRRHKDKAASGSTTPGELSRTNSSSWSFRNLRNSFRRKKRDDEKDGEAGTSTPSAEGSSKDLTKDSKGLARGSFKARRSTKGSTDTAAPYTKSEYFKSKKGNHLWMSRTGSSEIVLTTVAMDAMLLSEASALQAFARHRVPVLLQTSIEPMAAAAAAGSAPSAGDMTTPKQRKSLFSRISKRIRSHSTIAQPSVEKSPSVNAYIASRGGVPSTVFNIPLQQLLEQDRIRSGDEALRMPIIVSTTIAFLREKGPSASGVFRVPGSTRRIRQINEAFETSKEVDMSYASPNDVASVLKFFLRSLPVPLLTFDLHSAFLRIIQVEPSQQLTILRLLVALLPPVHRVVLQALLSLLALVADAADIPNGTKMNSHNLALVLAPNLLWSPDTAGKERRKTEERTQEQRQSGLSEDDAARLSDEGDACELVECMIDYHEHLFVVPPELRDDVLLFHQLANPELVTAVISELVTASKTAHRPSLGLGIPPTAPTTFQPATLPGAAPSPAGASPGYATRLAHGSMPLLPAVASLAPDSSLPDGADDRSHTSDADGLTASTSYLTHGAADSDAYVDRRVPRRDTAPHLHHPHAGASAAAPALTRGPVHVRISDSSSESPAGAGAAAGQPTTGFAPTGGRPQHAPQRAVPPPPTAAAPLSGSMTDLRTPDPRGGYAPAPRGYPAMYSDQRSDARTVSHGDLRSTRTGYDERDLRTELRSGMHDARPGPGYAEPAAAAAAAAAAYHSSRGVPQEPPMRGDPRDMHRYPGATYAGPAYQSPQRPTAPRTSAPGAMRHEPQHHQHHHHQPMHEQAHGTAYDDDEDEEGRVGLDWATVTSYGSSVLTPSSPLTDMAKFWERQQQPPSTAQQRGGLAHSKESPTLQRRGPPRVRELDAPPTAGARLIPQMPPRAQSAGVIPQVPPRTHVSPSEAARGYDERAAAAAAAAQGRGYDRELHTVMLNTDRGRMFVFSDDAGEEGTFV